MRSPTHLLLVRVDAYQPIDSDRANKLAENALIDSGWFEKALSSSCYMMLTVFLILGIATGFVLGFLSAGAAFV